MPNSPEYADWLAMTSLDILESKRSVSRFFNTDYNKEFKGRAPIGDSVRVPYPQQYLIRTGLEYNPQAIARRHTTIEFEEPFGIDFEWDSAEQYLRMPRGRAKVEKEILEPAMSQLQATIDYKCAVYAAQHAASVVGALGTNPTTFDGSSAAARQIMQELGCPATGEKGMIVPPAVMRALKNSAISYMNPVTDIAKQFRTGIVGSGDGFEWYESPTLYRHTTGTADTGVTVSVAPASGATSIVLAATTGETYKKGDKFAIAATLPVHPQTRRTFGTATKTFTVLADVTAASSLMTVSFSPAMYGPGSQYQNVDVLPVASAAVTLWPGTTTPDAKVGQVALALHPNAFALVSAELEEPKASSVELIGSKRDPDSGIYIRFIRAWDNKSSKMTNRFDVMLGFGEFFNDACAVAVACG